MTRATLVTTAMSALLALISVALFLVLLDRESAPPIVIEGVPSKLEIAVSIEGEVVSPGVYRLPVDSRLADAVAAAGGFTTNADVTKLNLASRLSDEQRIIIASYKAAAFSSPIAIGTTALAGSKDALIDINTATADELDALPGIGPVLAARIVAYRESHGPFTRIEELARVEGISPAMVDEFRGRITVTQ